MSTTTALAATSSVGPEMNSLGITRVTSTEIKPAWKVGLDLTATQVSPADEATYAHDRRHLNGVADGDFCTRRLD